jgi:hypothetical protein
VDRDAIAREVRRREATEALEFERDREDVLQDQIHELVAELEGERVDEVAFARMESVDAELARSILRPGDDEALEEADGEDWSIPEEGEPGEEQADPRDEAELEIARLQGEVDDSRRRQEAIERYLEALG